MSKKNLKKISKVYKTAVLVMAVFASTNLSAKTKIEDMTSKEAEEKAPVRISSTKDNINVPSVGIGFGQTFMLGNFADHGNDSITVTDLLFNYSASYSFDLLIDAHLSKHSKKDEWVVAQGVSASIKYKWYNFDNFAPFALGGLGFYAPKIKRMVGTTMIESKTRMTMGMNFGGGAELRLNEKYIVGVMGMYQDPFDVKQDYGPDVEGSYFKLLMTLLYSF